MSARIKRPVRIVGEIAYVTLTQGYEAIIDAADAPWIGMHNWYASNQGGGRIYCARNVSKLLAGPRRLHMHRAILGHRPGLYVDHINGNTLDNRRCNLRWATPTENNANRRISSRNRSGVKGVVATNCKSKPWAAYIRINRTARNLGNYETKEAAAAAYAAAAKQLFGEFARFE